MASRRRYTAISVAATIAFSAAGITLSGAVGAANPDVATTIPEIQGAGHLSTYDGSDVTTSGVVTAVGYDGYWIQDPQGDGDDKTSDGIFVYTGSDGAKPKVGGLVEVTGTVNEFRPGSLSGPNLMLTELTDTTFTVREDDAALPEPVRIGPGGRRAPQQTIDSSTTRTDIETLTNGFLPDTDAIDFYETLESMTVSVVDAEVVGPTNQYGELVVLPGDSSGLPRTARGGVRYGSYAKPNPQRLVIDDAVVFGEMPAANVGDTLRGEVTGPLSYDFGTFRILPVSVPEVVSGGIRPEVATAQRRGEFAVATYNVENLDPTDPDTAFQRHAETIVHNLASPDVIALEEIQDNTGAECPDGPSEDCTPDGVVDADQTLNELTAAIEVAGGPAYEWRQISPENLADGGQPTGNIRAAFLYRTDRGTDFVDRGDGDATTATEVVPDGGEAALTLSPGRVDPTNPAFADSRKPLAGEFVFDPAVTAGGPPAKQGSPQKYIVVANHFSSKGGDEPLTGRWQPPNRPSEEDRHAQAAVVNEFVRDVQAVSDSTHVIVLGDVNDFEFSTTTDILVGEDAPAGTAGIPGVTESTLVDLPRHLPARERYSYVFEGNSQVLDHILVSPAAARTLVTYDSVHVNAEFADQASDHDPQLVRLAP